MILTLSLHLQTCTQDIWISFPCSCKRGHTDHTGIYTISVHPCQGSPAHRLNTCNSTSHSFILHNQKNIVLLLIWFLRALAEQKLSPERLRDHHETKKNIAIIEQASAMRMVSGEEYMRSSVYYSVVNKDMKKMDTTGTVDDTEENLEICKKYCGNCPTYRTNKLSELPPHALFCARGVSSISSQVRPVNCYCPACEIFTKCGLKIGYFCNKS